ncbi:hypothetical protein QTP86_001877 [Hemibagrus guttatus]|nr:hypothetical protein QTP86_001877 [Hemibagrus guttatus]
MNWPEPTTVKELQCFLRFTNFYRRFSRGYSSIASPLTSLLKGPPKHLRWAEEAQGAFMKLNRNFTTSLILRHPDPKRPFIMEVDASNCGIGAVLSQRHGTPGKFYSCAFFSRQLSPTEGNYDVGNKELLLMKTALEELCHWLEGAVHPFVVLTDHRNLEYFRSARRLNPCQTQWVLFFTRFQFSVSYRPGSKNGKVDALS